MSNFNGHYHLPSGSKECKVVVIGGGTGSATLLQGLKRDTTLTAIVTMFDSGGSSGLLQAEFGYPPLGDLRQCLLSLSNENGATKILRDLTSFRFHSNSSLQGHSLGNLLLAALMTLGEDLEYAIDEMARLLQISGQVVPVSLHRAELCAELEDGRILFGESSIDLRREPTPKIKRVFLEPLVPENPKAIDAILNADVVVIGPGDLYTSIIPNLLIQGISDALASTAATRVYVCNLMTKPGETDSFKASDFVREILRYLRGADLDWVIVNANVLSKRVVDAYLSEGSHPVEADMDLIQQHVPGVIRAYLVNDGVPLKHAPDLIAQLVLRIAEMGRLKESPQIKVSKCGVTRI